MSFQAYLDAIEQKTGKTPNELLALAKEKGFTRETKAGEVVDWLKEDYELGRGGAMRFVYVFKHGTKILYHRILQLRYEETTYDCYSPSTSCRGLSDCI